MDFLKLVQKKEYKTDNKIIISMVVLVILIMGAVIFWPSSSKHSLLTYLPDNTSFYYHFTNKSTFKKDFFNKEVSQDLMTELESVLGNNFLNLQEVLLFKTDDNQANNYLLSFSRLPKSFFTDLENREVDFTISSLQKNILLLSYGGNLVNLEEDLEKNIYFEEGISVFWKKNKVPGFLKELATIIEPVFVGDDVLLNWQSIGKNKNKISLLENRTSEIKDVSNFLALKDFDLVFGFNTGTNSLITENFSVELLKMFFDSLPYYNLNDEVIKDRILNDSILWKKDNNWILASNREWQEDILDFIDYFVVEEVPGVLQDGTAYVELVAAPNQNLIEHNINGQKVIQIGEVFIWDIADQHYLSNSKKLIEDLSSDNRYVGNMIATCLNERAKIGDFADIKDKSVLDSFRADYLADYETEELQMVSYSTSTITGLNICF